MFNVFKSTGVFGQISRGWRLLVGETFCCRVKPDLLLSPKRNLSYETFTARSNGETSDDALSSYGDHDVLQRPSSLEGAGVQVEGCQTTALDNDMSTAIEKQPTIPPLLEPIDSPSNIPKTPLSTDACNKDVLSPSSEYSSSGVSSGILTQPSSMEFSDALANEESIFPPDDSESEEKTAMKGEEVESITDTFPQLDHVREDNEATSGEIVENNGTMVTTTNDELLNSVDQCTNALDVLKCVRLHQGGISPLLAVACIHYTFLKTLEQHERNSPSYNGLCGEILTTDVFRDMVKLVETNCKTLNNFALLTAASDLLYLRTTLKKPTISTLLSSLDYDSLNLDELRLLAGCLHTPSIPLLNSEYMYNVAASVAMRHLDDIQDLYTLLSIIKCFGRYFTTQAKRHADTRVTSFIDHLSGIYPDGRLNASHLFDAFYRMEYAPSRPLQMKACRVISTSTTPLVQQDITAILRYYVKYGFTMSDVGFNMLERISSTMYNYMRIHPITQFTTNVKWLSVFYYYDEVLLERYVELVRMNMNKLDFVALSDVLDALSQVYYVPRDGDDFFEQLNNEMLQKYPTLHRSNVKNVQRKLLLTAFHFSVFGRYPWQLIKLTLTNEQMQFNRGATKHFLNDFCNSLRIERPDLLPAAIPVASIGYSSPKLYAFENDVRSVLQSVVGSHEFTHVSSPVRGLPMFLLQQQLDGSVLPMRRKNTMFIPPHVHQTVQNVAVIPLPRSRFCIGSKHAVGKTRHAIRLVRAQGARIVTVPHFEWDGHPYNDKKSLLRRKIFEQRVDDVIE